MSVLDKLIASAGNWRGTNRLYHPTTLEPEDSPSTATLTPLLGGRFIRLDYHWGYQGKLQEGSLLLGYDSVADEIMTYWIDTWHMGDKVLVSRGNAQSDGSISVLGSYAAPPGPDWGWRTVIKPDGRDSLGIAMVNIDPDGREQLAVEASYSTA